jgi:hypothetical protein
MTYIMKRVSIAIMVAVFIATMCLPMTMLPSKVYADTTYVIGDNGPAGGKIFYKWSDGAGGWRYLEAATSDQSTGIQWYNGENMITTATATAIGTGFANTETIISKQGPTATSYAAGLARAYNGGGFTDWFLPSINEINQMFVIGGLLEGVSNRYWSSTEDADPDKFGSEAWDINSGAQISTRKDLLRRVRAIRAFTVPAATGSVAATYVEPVWVRTMPMTCYKVWINADNKFQFIFWYPYRDNNWVKIYDMSGKMVYEIDMPYNNPNLIVDLPDGMYTVKTYNVDPANPIQTFLIGKP